MLKLAELHTVGFKLLNTMTDGPVETSFMGFEMAKVNDNLVFLNMGMRLYKSQSGLLKDAPFNAAPDNPSLCFKCFLSTWWSQMLIRDKH